jgi:hypothetical protein
MLAHRYVSHAAQLRCMVVDKCKTITHLIALCLRSTTDLQLRHTGFCQFGSLNGVSAVIVVKFNLLNQMDGT